MDAYSWLAQRALGQNTAFNQDIASCRLPLQIPFQHSSLPPIWFCPSFHTYTVAFREKVRIKNYLKAPGMRAGLLNLFQHGLGWVNPADRSWLDCSGALPADDVVQCSKQALRLIPPRALPRGGSARGKYISIVALWLLWVFAASLWQHQDAWCRSSEIQGTVVSILGGEFIGL